MVMPFEVATNCLKYLRNVGHPALKQRHWIKNGKYRHFELKKIVAGLTGIRLFTLSLPLSLSLPVYLSLSLSLTPMVFFRRTSSTFLKLSMPNPKAGTHWSKTLRDLSARMSIRVA